MLYWVMCRCAGDCPASLCHQCRARTPSFFFVREKERWGRKKKPYRTIRRGEADVVARGRRCVAAGFRPPTVKIEPFRTSVAASMPANAHAVAAYCLLPAPPRLCVATCCGSGASDCLGAGLRGRMDGFGGCSESTGLSVFRRRDHTGIRGWGAVSGFLFRIFHLIQRPTEPDATFPSRGRLWLAVGSGGGWD